MIKFALLDNDWVFAGDYENGMNCTCPFCGERVAGRLSDKAPEHFFHVDSNTACDHQEASRLAMIGGTPKHFSEKKYQVRVQIPNDEKIKRTRKYSESLADIEIEKDIHNLKEGLGSYGFCVIEGKRIPILFDYSFNSSSQNRSQDCFDEMSKKFSFFVYQYVSEHSVSLNNYGLLNALYFSGDGNALKPLVTQLIELNPVQIDRFPQLSCLVFAPEQYQESTYFKEHYKEDGFARVCFYAYRVQDYIFEPKLKKSEFLKFYVDTQLAEQKWSHLSRVIEKIEFFLSFNLCDKDFYFDGISACEEQGFSERECAIWDARPHRNYLYKRAPNNMRAYFKAADDEIDEIAMGEGNPYKKNFEERWGLRKAITKSNGLIAT